MIGDSDLPRAHDVIAGRHRTGQSHLGDEQVVAADLAVVSDHHQVIELRPLADHRFVDHRAVDRRAGADLDVVFDPHGAEVRDPLVPAVDDAVSKAVRSDHRAGMNRDTASHDDVFIQDRVRMKYDVVADVAAAADDGPRMDVAVVADHHSRGDMRTGMNVRVPADLGRRTHISAR